MNSSKCLDAAPFAAPDNWTRPVTVVLIPSEFQFDNEVMQAIRF
jgi:hypothetical protein